MFSGRDDAAESFVSTKLAAAGTSAFHAQGVPVNRQYSPVSPADTEQGVCGIGCSRYRYDSGHAGTAALVAFSPRKANLVLYLVGGVQDRYPSLLEQLGPHNVGKGCLYLRRLDDIDHHVLHALVEQTVRVHRGADRRASAGS